jgi:hypothetical protein
MSAPAIKRLLLLGAGFTRNWGGWLAGDVFEYLLADTKLDPSVRELLFRYRDLGGVERALGELQDEHERNPSPPNRARLAQLEDGLYRMFTDMDEGLKDTAFEFQSDLKYALAPFLVKFDAIFTLNQDLWFERRYLNDNVMLMSANRWGGYQIPGMRKRLSPDPSFADMTQPNAGQWEPSADFQIDRRLQPYVKLHGSCNWRSADARIIVLGGRKIGLINRFPILTRYDSYFRQCLSSGPVRLMIIGYSFGDDHINDAIMKAAAGGQLDLFIIDVLGIAVIDKNRGIPLYSPDVMFATLHPHVKGASSRTLREIFGPDHVEHTKVVRFVQ